MSIKTFARSGICLFLLGLALLLFPPQALAYDGPIGTSQMLVKQKLPLFPPIPRPATWSS